MRIYKRDVQEKVLEIIGISPEEVRITFFFFENYPFKWIIHVVQSVISIIYTDNPYLTFYPTNRLNQSLAISWRLLTWVLLLMVCKCSQGQLTKNKYMILTYLPRVYTGSA